MGNLIGLALLIIVTVFVAYGYASENRTGLGRGCAMTILIIFSTGFGLCGAWGFIEGLSSIAKETEVGYGKLFLILGAVGLLFAGAIIFLITKINRKNSGKDVGIDNV